MKKETEPGLMTRRDFARVTAVAGLSIMAAPYISLGATPAGKPITRVLGRTGFEATTLGLGGQASLQWTPAGENPEQIIIKALSLGINYFDTSNLYGPSQLNYGKAFRALNVIPGNPGYDEVKRRSVFLASKTHLRYAQGEPTTERHVKDFTNGLPGSKTVDDVKRTLSQIFGDGKGSYPPGAYVDLFQIHSLTTIDEVDAIYAGLENPDPKAERIGALAALRDYRDGTNLTGLNPKEEKLIRHIGITGHLSSPVLMECLQRDEGNLIDTLLVALNANDRRYFSHQYNVIPLAVAKNVGLIAMKVFADGAMYGKGNFFSRAPEHVVRLVGSSRLPSQPLIQYTLSTPGIATTIIGIGHIDQDSKRCQLVQNLAAAQLSGPLDDGRRRKIEQLAAQAKEGKTNYFQLEAEGLSPPRAVAVSQEMQGDFRIAQLTWQTAYAGDQPLSHYEIFRDQEKIGRVDHQPQTTKKPFAFQERLNDRMAHRYRVAAVDSSGRMAGSGEFVLPVIG